VTHARALCAALASCLLSATASAQAPETSVRRLSAAIHARTMDAVGGLEGDIAIRVTTALPDDAPDATGLGAALVAPLMEALREEPRFVVVEQASGDLDAAAAARRGLEAAVMLDLRTRASVLEVRGTVVEAARGGFRDLFAPSPRVVGRFGLHHRLDAHLRAFVGPLPRVDESRIVARTVPLPGRGYVAMATADLDRDGRTELVLVQPDRAQVLRLGSTPRGTYRAERVAEVAPEGLDAAPSRPRRAIGTALPTESGVVIRTSHLAAPWELRLTAEGASARRAEGPCRDEHYPLLDACAERVTGRDWFEAELVPRAGRSALPDAPAGFYARVADHVPATDGSFRAVDVVVTPRGRIGARVDGQRGGAVGYGAALGMADLEDDGLPEVLVSSPSAPGEPDRLSLLRLREDATLITVWSSEEIEGAVMLAGHGDLDDDGRIELLAVEEPAPGERGPARLWVVQ